MRAEIREAVYKRDRGVCYLCGRQAYQNVPDEHPRRLTLDHVLAKANGGKDERNNLRCACRGCNLKKGVSDISGNQFLADNVAEVVAEGENMEQKTAKV